MKLSTISLFILPFLCKYFALARTKRAILKDFEWLSEDALAKKSPISAKVMESPKSFFHLGSDGELSDLSETLEIELDNAMDRKLNGDKEGAMSKREANPYTPEDHEVEKETLSLLPEASAVKQMKTKTPEFEKVTFSHIPEASAVKQMSCNCNWQGDQQNLFDENQMEKPISMKVQGEHQKTEGKHDSASGEGENLKDLTEEIASLEMAIGKSIPTKVEGKHNKNDGKHIFTPSKIQKN